MSRTGTRPPWIGGADNREQCALLMCWSLAAPVYNQLTEISAIALFIATTVYNQLNDMIVGVRSIGAFRGIHTGSPAGDRP